MNDAKYRGSMEYEIAHFGVWREKWYARRRDGQGLDRKRLEVYQGLKPDLLFEAIWRHD
jgi:hypothetical protein